MGLEHVSHAEISRFAKKYVNLPEEKVKQHRDQSKQLTDRLVNYLEEHPDFNLRRLVPSGSLAKGTALKQLNDIDIGCYISGFEDRSDIPRLIRFLVEKLQNAFPNFKPEQIKPQTYSVTVSFLGSGLDVDIVPILYDDDPNWYGYLVSQRNGELLKTNIPYHLEFIRKRKSKQKRHFAQLVRLIKYWKKEQQKENEGFRFKSFMIELILAKLVDKGMDCSDYIEGMQQFFTYILKSDIRELIYFTDYYSAHSVPAHSEPIRIIDPVNAKNNAAKLYSEEEADRIVKQAGLASDAIDSAIYATTKEKTVDYWRKVFGPLFNP